jgi:hypothetical protein
MTHALVRLFVTAYAASAIGTAAAQPIRADFDRRLPLTASDGLHVVEFPEAIYRAAQSPDLADVRIFNARDEILPFAFVPPPVPKGSTAPPVDLRIAPLPAEVEARESLLRRYALRVEHDRERALIEIEPALKRNAPASIGGYLIDARSLKDLKGQLVVSFTADAPNYASRVEILGSDDLVTWQRLVAGPLTHTRSLGDVILRNSFDLARPPAFLRIAWRSADSPVIEHAQFVEYMPPNIALPRATLAATLSDDRRSLYVDVPEALPITRVFVRVPELNRIVKAQVFRHVDEPQRRSRRSVLGPRRVQEHWQLIGAVEAFRVLRDGVEVEGAPLAYGVRTDRLRLDFPTPLQGTDLLIEAEYRPHRAVFVARIPSPFVLAVGHRDLQAGPMLDTRAILATDDPSGVRLPIATIDPTSGATAQDAQRAQRIASTARWSRYALWGTLAIAVLGLTWMAWRLSLQLRASRPSDDSTTATTESNAEVKRPAEGVG